MSTLQNAILETANVLELRAATLQAEAARLLSNSSKIREDVASGDVVAAALKSSSILFALAEKGVLNSFEIRTLIDVNFWLKAGDITVYPLIDLDCNSFELVDVYATRELAERDKDELARMYKGLQIRTHNIVSS